ncbi:MAG: hypothetical protein IPH57_18490 [Saprospiraceae bacterium]|nr:hypothetical protein [Saprospiraceae bacterium]
MFEINHNNNDFVENNKHILKGMLLNNMSKLITERVLSNNILEKIINESNTPKTPNEKFNNLLIYLHSIQAYEGSVIQFSFLLLNLNKLYFKNHGEAIFYLMTLRKQDMIEGIEVSSAIEKSLENIRLTFTGLTKVIELSEYKNNSINCFIAMSFSSDFVDLRNSIKNAIRKTGYKPILIDELNYNSDITINDALISEIKKCKFLVADFTQHKHGVYFEAGYALGLKKPVIYLCDENDFSNSHFDTNHYPHIIYSDYVDLEKN